MENMKHFDINTKEDAIFFLNLMITLTYKKLHRYKNLLADVKRTLDESTEDVIKVNIGNGLAERAEALDLFFYNLYGDDTKNTISYPHFRNTMRRKENKGLQEFKLPDVDEEIERLLKEMQDLRNWSHHIPQSLFMAEINYVKDREATEQLIRETHTGYIVYVLEYEDYAKERLEILYESIKERYSIYRKILQCMKKDYTYLLGERIRVITQYSETPKGIEGIEVATESLKINSRKRR